MNTTSHTIGINEPDLLAIASSGIGRGEQRMQEALAPTVAYENTHLEAFGKTLPLEEAGGDVVDLIEGTDGVSVYVADASGHGVRAAMLIGMVKTAIRYGLSLGQPLPEVVEGLNRVLPGLKEPNMYATLAGLHFDGSGEAEYLAAGHIPLLHYRHRQGDVVRWTNPQFPLGLFETASYASERIGYEPGDIFVLISDGVVETADAEQAEFGLEGVEKVLLELGDHPLPEIFDAIVDATTDHGAQQDDQSLLLIRVREWKQ